MTAIAGTTMRTTALAAATLAVLAGPATSQAPDQQARDARREAVRLDGLGQHAEARVIWQRLIDQAPDPAARAAAHRRMAMSYGFEGDCANAIRYHTLVIEYWKTRETEEPQNAHYQQGEMANESARVCIDAGHFDEAERMYRLGADLGNREPEPRTHPRSLWDFRTAHALGRLAARRGDKAEAERQVARARSILDADTAMAGPQERFFPQLAGYVALYTGDPARAEQLLSAAAGLRGNQNDPFLHGLLALTHERLGHADQARQLWERAYRMAEGGHNPPAAWARREGRNRLGG